MAGYVYGGSVDSLAARDQAWSGQRAASAQQGIENLMRAAAFVENIRRANQAAKLQQTELAQALMLDRERRSQEAALTREEMAARAASALDVQSLRNQGDLAVEGKRQETLREAERIRKEEDRNWREQQAAIAAQEKEQAAALKRDQDTYELLLREADNGRVTPEAVEKAMENVTDPGIRSRMIALSQGIRESNRQAMEQVGNMASHLNAQTAREREALSVAKAMPESNPRQAWVPWLGNVQLPNLLDLPFVPGQSRDLQKKLALEKARNDYDTAVLAVMGRMNPDMIGAIRHDPLENIFKPAITFGGSVTQPASGQNQAPPPPGSTTGGGGAAPAAAPDVSGMPTTSSSAPVTIDDIVTARRPGSGAGMNVTEAGQPVGVKVMNGGLMIDGKPIDLSRDERIEAARNYQRLLTLRDETGQPLHTNESALHAALTAVYRRKMDELRGP